MTQANKAIGRSSQRRPDNRTDDSASRDSWLFAQALRGEPASGPNQSAANDANENELREWLDAITHSSSPARAAGLSEQEHREWLDEIAPLREVTWDPSKHPRGGFPENPGWFSPSGGAGRAEKASGTGSRLRSWPADTPDHRGAEDDASRHSPTTTQADGDADYGTLLAQAPPPGPGKPQPPLPEKIGVYGRRKFGDFEPQPLPPGQDSGYAPADDPGVKKFNADLAVHLGKQIPAEVRERLRQGGVKVVYTDKLDRFKQYLPGDHIHAGSTYSPTYGTIFVPRILADGKDNEYVENNIRHEFGHALDHVTSGSLSDAFLEQYRADLKKIPLSAWLNDPDMRQFVPETYTRPPYSLRPEEAEQRAAREAFAQSFASVTAADGAKEDDEKTGWSKAIRFRERFEKTDKFMKGKFLPAFREQQLRRQQQQQQPFQNPPGQPRP